MGKVLVIRKSDKTIHRVPLSNKPALMAYSNRLPDDKKWKFEEMDEKEAEKLPFIDESYVTAAEAQGKVKELESSLSEKDEQLAALQAKIAQMESSQQAPPAPAPEAQGKVKELGKEAKNKKPE